MPTFATFLASHMGSRAMARMNPHQQLVALRDLLNDQGFNFQEDKEYTKFMSMDSSFRNDRKFVDDHHRLSLRLVGSDLDSPKVEVMKEKIRNGRVEKTYLGLFHIDTTKFIVSVIKRNASKRARTSEGSMAHTDTHGSRASSSSHPFGWAQVKGRQVAKVVKLSDAQRKPKGIGWGAVVSSGTRIGDVAYLDGGDVYLSHRMGKDSEEGSMARKNSTRRDVLQEDARKSGYFVETHSPGDGTTRYKFFSLAEMARKGISEREQGYFGPLNGVHTALGLAAAKKWLARAPSTHSSSSGSMAAKAPKSDYEVIVGNIGTVYRGTSFSAAQKDFATYREQSQSGYGRAAGESVTLMRDGEVIREFDAEAEAEGSMAAKAPKSDYEVIVGNIGTVYRGTSFAAAQKNFATYREQSQSGYGRAAGESVTLMRDGEVIREFDAEAEGSMDRVNKYEYLIVLQGYFRPGGWEDLFTVEKKGSGFDRDANREIKARLKEYRENDPRAYRLINRKTLRS